MVMIFAGGHISGAHYNPAVTLGVLIRGKVKPADVVPYIVAQLVGAAIAIFLVTRFLRAGVAINPMSVKMVPALLAEFLFYLCPGLRGLKQRHRWKGLRVTPFMAWRSE